jgi:hypothetical protein
MARRRRPLLRIASRFNRASRPSLDALESRLNLGSMTYTVPPGADTLRAAISAAESDANANDTIQLSAGTYSLTQGGGGEIFIENNATSVPTKTLTIVGQGQSSTTISADQPTIGAGFRDFEILGSDIVVVFEDLAITGGRASDGGQYGLPAAVGGGLLIEGGQVRLSNVKVFGNAALGRNGELGAAGTNDTNGMNGGDGGPGSYASGGGIYLYSGRLVLVDSLIGDNAADGGNGGDGGNGHGATGKPGSAGQGASGRSGV